MTLIDSCWRRCSIEVQKEEDKLRSTGVSFQLREGFISDVDVVIIDCLRLRRCEPLRAPTLSAARGAWRSSLDA